MILSSDAIILKSMKYGDTSRIVTAFTQEYGKISLIAKGARGKRSKFGSALEPLSFSNLVYYQKDGRDLQILSQADTMVQFRQIVEDERKLITGLCIAEFLHAVTMEGDPHSDLFDLTVRQFELLNTSRSAPEHALLRFLLALPDHLGFGLDLNTCIRCRADLGESEAVRESVLFDARDGGFACSDCTRVLDGSPSGAGTFRLLRSLSLGMEDIAKAESAITRECIDLLHNHLRTHIDGMRRIRSLALL